MQYRVARALLLAIMLLTLAWTAALGEGTELVTDESVPVAEVMVDGYLLTYSDLLTDGMICAPVEDTPDADLLFTLQLRTEPEWSVPVFTLTIGQDVGDWVTVLMGADGLPVPVAFAMADAPEGLTEAEDAAFTLAQEGVHVILASLTVSAAPDAVQAIADEASRSMKIVMDEYELSYTAALADVLFARETEDGELRFHIMAGEQENRVFTLKFGSDAGDIVIMLDDGAGSRIPVAFAIYIDERTFIGGQGTSTSTVSARTTTVSSNPTATCTTSAATPSRW